MEDYLFQEDLESYRYVIEATAFLEVYNYEVFYCCGRQPRDALLMSFKGAGPSYVDQSTLATDEDFHNFVRGTVRSELETLAFPDGSPGTHIHSFRESSR